MKWLKFRIENSKISVFFLLFLIFTALPVTGAEQKPVFQATKDKSIQQIRPNKPVKIKLQRKANGEYTWDITGDNADEIVKADKRLRKLLQID